MIKQLIATINKKETLLMVYQDRDLIRAKQLQDEIRALEVILLDRYTLENEIYLQAIKSSEY